MSNTKAAVDPLVDVMILVATYLLFAGFTDPKDAPHRARKLTWGGLMLFFAVSLAVIWPIYAASIPAGVRASSHLHMRPR